MELHDLLDDPEFAARVGKKRDYHQPFDALRQLTQVFAERPQDVLQELMNIAVSCCGADSAGISLAEPNEAGEPTFRWIAIAGSFEQYLGARTPRFFSPCGTCLDRGRAQLYSVTKPYYDFLGVTADPILDGMLIPWETDEIRGTIWAVAHYSDRAFEPQDYKLLRSLADFVAIILRQQAAEEKAKLTAQAEASAARAHKMAHQINNPLQCLTNTIFLASQGGPDTARHIKQAAIDLAALSDRVRKLLALRYGED
ncbi:GAF domain-containing protein [Acidicapsa dinghuensis]|uniref:GAF domain-containing protein n=1 Tax=Acidicapsa dinghuensis TaxID=2218256 RepID=A0ABW1EL71_9BACT|nr:GAF domain-containing protein [Acidicapsa dinghuensis]